MGDKMICPKCGNMVSDSRTTCQNCGNWMPTQTPFEQYTQTPTGQAPTGRDGQYQHPAAIGKSSSKKKIIVPVVIIVVIVIILVAVIGAVMMRQGVHLKIVNHDTEGGTVIVTLKNEGTETAKGEKIQIRCNGVDTFDWEDGDIKAGDSVKGEVELVGVGLFYWLEKLEVIYDGEVQHTLGY